MNAREDTLGKYEPGLVIRRRIRDRSDAGAQLARALERYRKEHPLVLALPRGGVPVAAEVARLLDADLDVLVSRKIGAPAQPEVGIGAVAADGTLFLNRELVMKTGISFIEIQERATREGAEALRWHERYRRGRPPLDLAHRTVILVDDGVATGATMRAALRSLRGSRAKKLVVAVPVGAPKTCSRIALEVDELVCLHRPEPFLAASEHYQTFEQTTDDEVDRLLDAHRARRAGDRSRSRA